MGKENCAVPFDLGGEVLGEKIVPIHSGYETKLTVSKVNHLRCFYFITTIAGEDLRCGC